MKEYGEVLENVDLKNYNTYRIGGKARFIIKPYNIKCLIKLLKYLKEKNIKCFVLGKGSNVIIPDKDYNGTVILLDNLKEIKINGNIVEVESGVILTKFINSLINNNLGGLENLYGIPGTLGGAIHGNAGCYGSTISDFLISVTYLENEKVKTLQKDKCEFLYRDSIFKHDRNKIILSAQFKLINKDKNEMKITVKENLIKRKNSQPLEFHNAGSVFRNPTNNSAGKLIDEIGLKGYSVNDAEVSIKHANFIINRGNATSEDIKELIYLIKEKIKDNYDIDLILEQEIVKY